MSFAAVNRAEIAGRRSVQNYSYEGVRSDLAAKRSERATIGPTRSTGTVAAELKSIEQQPRFQQSNRCEAAEGREARSLCERYHVLSGELATAQQAERIDGAIADLATKLDRASTGAAGTTAIDPQVDLFRELSGFADGKIKLALAILVCVLIEAGSGLGLFVVLSCHRALAEEAAVIACTSPIVPTFPAGASDADWLHARVQPAAAGMIGAAELYADYRLWMEARGRSNVLTVTAFGRWMTDIGIARDKVGGRIVYRGAELHPARLPIPLAVPV